MKKISIKNVIEFTRKSDRSKQSFASALKYEKKRNNLERGGDYWVSAISAISNSYKSNDTQPIVDKKFELEEKYENTEYKRSKIMYKRNIDILHASEESDLTLWRPTGEIKFLKKHREHSVLNIDGLQIQVTPNHIFSLKNKGIEELGAIWFIAKLNGYKKEELGMFTDILYRSLKHNFSKDYKINPQYCIAVDIVKGISLNYIQFRQEEVTQILDSTIKEIKALM